jgi:hypothetical protein
MDYSASYKEYIFSKNFSKCVSIFNKYFESEVRVIDEPNLDPYTECMFIFIQSAVCKCTSIKSSYTPLDPVAHSYNLLISSDGNKQYSFCENMRIKIMDRLMDIVQKKLGLYRIYESKNSTTKKIESINKSVIDILDNYLQEYSNDAYIKKLLVLCKNSANIDRAEEIQKELIKMTKNGLNDTVNKLYEFYCKVRLQEPITNNDKNKTRGVVELVPIDKSFFTLRYVLDGGCGGCGGKGGGCDGKGGGDGKGGCGNTVDTINFNIHSTRIDRLRSLYKKNNKENYNENHFLDCLYACIRRYRTIFWQHHVFFGNSMPPKTFELWENYSQMPLKAGLRGLKEVVECFADPFNCYLEKYYSPFPDVDQPFGSIGSFFDNPPTRGIAIAHPPTEKYFLLEATKTIISTIHKSKNNVIFIVGLPVWKEYMKTDAIKLVETYPSISINTPSLVLSNSDLTTPVNSKKTYYYKYKLYILSNYNPNIDLVRYSKAYTNIFMEYSK